jgi:hypothetical protein
MFLTCLGKLPKNAEQQKTENSQRIENKGKNYDLHL